MKCPQCGEENRDIARFCQHCGALVHQVEVQEAEVEIPTTDENMGEPAVEAEIVFESADIDEIGPERVVQDGIDWEAGEPLADVEENQVTQIAMEPISLAEIQAFKEAMEEPGTEPADQDVEPIDTGLIAAEPVEPEWVEEPVEEAPLPDVQANQEEHQVAWDSDETDELVETQIGTLEQVTDAADADIQEPVEMVEELESIPDDDSESNMDDLFWREPVEAMVALESGTVVNGRYLVSEVLSAKLDEVLYRVRDLQRCPQCGYDENNPDQAFCESCGAVLDRKPFSLMLVRSIDRQDTPVEASVEQQFVEGEFAYWVWQEASTTEPPAESAGRMRFVVGQKSDVGRQRDLDEDAMFVFTMESTYESVPAQMGLFVVADGMGGHEGGEVASRLVIRTTTGELLHKVFSFELTGCALSPQELQKAMIAAVQEGNEKVYLERQKRKTDMGTTITAVILKEWMAYVAHVGDCRAFRWGEDGLKQLTTDHSIVASMVATGTAKPDEIYTHPQRSVIYRSIGDQPSVDVDVSSQEFCPGDRLIVCCDGLWEMIRNEGIEEVLMRQPDPQLACEEMVDLANLAGGTDNISVIVVQL